MRKVLKETSQESIELVAWCNTKMLDPRFGVSLFLNNVGVVFGLGIYLLYVELHCGIHRYTKRGPGE